MNPTHNQKSSESEVRRLIALSEMDLDYSALNDLFRDLTILASSITGTDHSVVNLIDDYTQWTVSTNNKAVSQCAREDSVCQFVVSSGQELEVTDLRADERVKDLGFVKDNPDLKYYYGLPLKTKEGYSIGAFCVLDQKTKILTEEQISLLKIIGSEVTKRLDSIRTIAELKRKVATVNQKTKRVAHDIRGPVGGIIGLSEVVVSDEDMPIAEVKEIVGVIHDSSKTLLELTDEILHQKEETQTPVTQRDLAMKLETLFAAQAKNKNILFKVETESKLENIAFTGIGLLQITGNLISNALKFTLPQGRVEVQFELLSAQQNSKLKIAVADTGLGIEPERVALIKSGSVSSLDGTAGEKGFGLGIKAVKYLIDQQGGELDIESKLGVGTTFTVVFPVNRLYE